MGLEESHKWGKNPLNGLLNEFFCAQIKKNILLHLHVLHVLGQFLFLCNEVENGNRSGNGTEIRSKIIIGLRIFIT